MKLNRTEITLDLGIYGKKTVTAYAANGLAVHKHGSGWRVSHVASGGSVHARQDRRLKADAVIQMEKLLALPIDWAKDWADIGPEFRANAAGVRNAMEG